MAGIYLAFQSDSGTAAPVLDTYKHWNVVLPLVNPPELEDEDGVATGTTLTRSGTVVDWKNLNSESDNATSGDAAWVQEAAVINDAHSFDESGRTFTLSGFSPGEAKDLEFYSGATAGYSATVAVNGAAPVALAGAGVTPINLTETTVVSATADGSGDIVFVITGSNSPAFINAMRVLDAAPPPPSVTLSGDLQPGQPFTATATNFASAPVSPATITQDSYTGTVPVTVVDDGGGTYTVTGTMPALTDSGTSPKFGQVTLELATA